MSRVSRIHAAMGHSYYGLIRFDPPAVQIQAGTFTDPDYLYAYACGLMAAADKLRKALR